MKQIIIIAALLITSVAISNAQLNPQEKRHPHFAADASLIFGAGVSLYVAGTAHNADLMFPYYTTLGMYFICVGTLFYTVGRRAQPQKGKLSAGLTLTPTGPGIVIRF